ncbi:MAG: CocE/NonD family hydrolase [Pseudomonadota bacterium]
MTPFFKYRLLSLVSVVLVLCGCGSDCPPNKLACSPIESTYDSYRRVSQYITLPDGNELAVDVLQPLDASGSIVAQPLPVVYTHTVYNRAMYLVKDGDVRQNTLVSFGGIAKFGLWLTAFFNDGELVLDQGAISPWVETLILQGYVVVAVDTRGTGASPGLPIKEAQEYVTEAGHILDWIVTQPWSNGRVGVFGQSYSAQLALMGIATQHPSLEAAFLSSTPIEAYESIGFPFGLYAKGFGDNYIAITKDLDILAAPVDGELGQQRLTDALQEREGRRFADDIAQVFKSSNVDAQKWNRSTALGVLPKIESSQVKVLGVAGWADIFVDDTIRFLGSRNAPSKLIIRPWHHRPLLSEAFDFDPAVHAVAWFDHWLKNKRTEIEGSDVDYFSISASSNDNLEGKWCKAESWPPTVEPAHLVLEIGDIARSTQLYAISAEAVQIFGEGTTSGINSRWNGVLGSGIYEDLLALNPGAYHVNHIVEREFDVVGHPKLTLHVHPSEMESTLHVFLELVSNNDRVRYLSEGVSVIPPMSDEVSIELLPVAFHVRPGDALRVTFLAADQDNFKSRPRQGAIRIKTQDEYLPRIAFGIARCAN